MKKIKMNNKAIPRAGFFKQINILYLALLFGQLAITVILLYVKSETEGVILLDNMSIGIESAICICLGLFAFFGGKKVYQRLIDRVSGSLATKLQRFQAAYIIRLALVEGVTILSVILFFISSQVICLLIGIGFLLLFTTMKPTRQKVIGDLKLTASEQRELNDF